MASKAKKTETPNPAVIKDPMVHILEVKKPYTDKEKLEFSHIMADALSIISQKEAELKEFSVKNKAEVGRQEDALYSCGAKIKQGYEMVSVPCIVTYDGKLATFTSKETGEIVEKRELTEEEQLRLTGQWHDAEEIIREDSERDK